MSLGWTRQASIVPRKMSSISTKRFMGDKARTQSSSWCSAICRRRRVAAIVAFTIETFDGDCGFN